MCPVDSCLAILLATVLAGAGTGARGADEVDTPQVLATEQARLTRIDVPNVAASTLPDRRTDLAIVSAERWASRGRAGIGVGVGSVMLVDRSSTRWPAQQRRVLPPGPRDRC